MTLLQGIRLYPKAILWSVLISTCIAMEGYDVCLGEPGSGNTRLRDA